jgi:hypothetical protein
MNASQTLQNRYEEVRNRVGEACARAGRSPTSVILVAVAKYAEIDDIRELIELGHRDFGENRVQQLVQRAAVVKDWFDRMSVLERTRAQRTEDASAPGAFDPSKPVRWHMIGSLQRNKARKVVEFSRLIHSVDSLRLAEELQVIANKRDEVIDVLIQVNCSGEEQKHGCPVPAAGVLAEQIDTMINVRVRGLMTMAEQTDDRDKIRSTFRRCRELFEDIRHEGAGEGRFDLLSMGMSGDYEIALEEGANIVRVGSSIFGERPEPVEA